MHEKNTKIGLERVSENSHLSKDWGRCGLVCNQASLAYGFVHTVSILSEILGTRLVAIFGPQHGFKGTVQDNMIETENSYDQSLKIPIYSLYGEHREPTEKMLFNIDTILIDLQTVGCRVYTFKYTIAACLRAAKKFKKKVVVLDRPNPLGGTQIEGRCLEASLHSFVGEFEIPMRHGLTPGEAAKFFNQSIKAELEVISMLGWNPAYNWHETNRPWVMTSPNLPSLDSVFLYPGLVAFEGCNLSEGRGTTLPFQFMGAPFISNLDKLLDYISSIIPKESGVFLRQVSFQPTYGKWKGQECFGFQVHLTDFDKMCSYLLSMAILHAVQKFFPMNFSWIDGPYEYEYRKKPIKLILGSESFEEHLEDFDKNNAYWYDGISDYIDKVRPLLLYERKMEVKFW